MIISMCTGYRELDGTLHECGVIYNRRDDGKEEEIISHGYCPKCFQISEDLAEAFYDEVGSKINMY